MAEQFGIPGSDEAIANLIKVKKEVASIASELLKATDIAEKTTKSFRNISGFSSSKKFTDNSKKANEDLLKTNKDLELSNKRLVSSKRSLEVALSKEALAIQQNRVETSRLNKENKEAAKLISDNTGAYEKASLRLKRLRTIAKDVGIQIGTSSTEFQELAKKVNAADKELKELDASLGDNQREVGSYSDAVGELFPLFGRLQSSLERIANTPDAFESGLPALSSFRKGIASITKAALAFIATPIGAAITALSAIGLVTKEFLDYNESIRESLKLTQDLTGLSGRGLGNLRSEVDAVAKTYDKEFLEVLRAANTVSKNFGTSQTEALDLIQQGFVEGADASGEYLDTLREYPVLFSNAGFTAKDFFSIVTASTTEGVFSDKLVDSLKELELSLKEQTTAAKESLTNAFGKQFTTELFNNITNGSLTTKEAFDQISQQVSLVGVNSQQAAQLTADLFRGAGEDAGGFLNIVRIVNGALSDEEKELTSLQKASLQLTKVNRELAKAKDDALNSNSAQVFSARVRIAFALMKTSFFNLITDFRDGFGSIAGGFKSILTPIIDLIKRIPFLNNIVEKLKSSFKDLGEIVPITPFKLFTAILRVVGASLSGIGAVIKQVKQEFIDIGNAVKNIDFTDISTFKNLALEVTKSGLDLGVAYKDAFLKSFNGVGDEVDKNSVALKGATTEREKEAKAIQGSLGFHNDLIKKYQEERDRLATTTEQREVYNEKIKEAELQIEILTNAVKDLGSAQEELSFDDAFEILDSGDEALKELNEFRDAVKSTFDDLGTPDDIDSLFDNLFSEDEISEAAKRLDDAKSVLSQKQQELYEDLGDGAKELALTIADSLFEVEQNRLDDQIESNNNYYDNLLENESLTEDERKALSQERKDEEERLQKAKAETENKAFLISQGVKVAEIAIDTAQKVAAIKATAAAYTASGLLPAAGLALSQIPLVIGFGAIAAGTVAAQTIPAFKDGKPESNNYEGWAEVGEVRDEVKVDKYGNASIIPKGSGVQFVSREDIIYPSIDVFKNEMPHNILHDHLVRSSMIASAAPQKDQSIAFEKAFEKYANINQKGIEKAVSKAIIRANINVNATVKQNNSLRDKYPNM